MARPSNALTLALAASLPLFACKSDDVTGKGGVEPPSGPAPDPFTFSLTTPDTPLITGSTSVDVAGTITGDQPVARVNGVEVEIVDGGFATEAAYEGALWADSPLFPVLAEGVNADGAWARERVMLAVGESTSTADTLYSAIGARLTDHALEQLGPAIDNIIGGLDLTRLLVSEDPVTTVLGADVYVTDASFGAVEVSLGFTRDGLAYDLTARDVTVALLVDAGWFDTDGDVDVQQIDVDGVIEMGISGGELTLTPFDTSVLITGLGIFGFSDPTGIIDGLVNDFLSETLAGLLEEQVIDLADELVGLLDEITELELEGLVLETDFASVSHDDDGITLLADTRVTATTGTLPAERFANPGDMPVILGQTAPSGAPYAVGLYLDDDLLSAIGAGLVAAELLNQEVGGDLGALTLDTTLLGAAVPGFGRCRRESPSSCPPGPPSCRWARRASPPRRLAGCTSAGWRPTSSCPASRPSPS